MTLSLSRSLSPSAVDEDKLPAACNMDISDFLERKWTQSCRHLQEQHSNKVFDLQRCQNPRAEEREKKSIRRMKPYLHAAPDGP